MKKVAIIIQRYGEEVSGGGEFYARELAKHLSEFHDVTVLTTTSLDYMDWDQHYSAGESNENGVRILRFQNRKGRNWKRFQTLSDELCDIVRTGEKTPKHKDLEWADAEGPYSPDLVNYVEQHKDDYDVFIVITYIYYTAIRCLPLVASKAIFVPTAHDEIWIRFSVFRELFDIPRYFAFLTEGEHKFVRSFFKNEEIPGQIIGCGVDVPEAPDSNRFREKYGIHDDYVVFTGRVDVSKSCDEMIDFFLRYKQKNPSNLKLVLIGKSSMEISKHQDIVLTGFVSEQDKFDGISGALAMIAPSKVESLCIALLEGFACGVPALVNGECEVLKEHCIEGQAGLYYTSYEEFAACMDYLVNNTLVHNEMSVNARQYIDMNYTWNKSMEKLNNMIDDITRTNESIRLDCAGRNVMRDRQIKAEIIIPNQDTEIEPAFSKNSVTVCFSSSDYFAPMCGVTISSLIANTDSKRFYDIFVMITDMSVQNINLLKGLASGHTNISLRFIDVTEIIESYKFSLASYYTPFTFYRLLIPKLMCKYAKVLYLDSDMVVNKDIAELYDTDLTGFYLAATLDLPVMCWQLMDDTSPMHQYLDSLDLLQPGTYMQGGVSLYNISEFNKSFSTEFLLEKATERTYLTCDQDLINIYCKGRIKFVSQKWNMVNMKDAHEEFYNDWLPQKYYDEYIEARKDPYIVHYGAQMMPCFEAGVDYYPLFWKYAKQTPFYEQLLSILAVSMAQGNIKKIQEMENDLWDTLGNLQKNKKKKTYMKLCDFFFPRGSGRREFLKKLVLGKMKIQADTNSHFSELLAQMSYKGEAERLQEGISLAPGAMLYGPYIKLSSGEHHLIVVADFNFSGVVNGNITAEAGKVQIANFQLRKGRNDFYFELERPRSGVEFVIENVTENNILVSGLQFL